MGQRIPRTWQMVLLLLLLTTPGAATVRAEEERLPSDASAEDILDALLGVSPAPSEAPAWQGEGELRQGGGYAKNILYSPFIEEDSAFALTEAELFLLRQSESAHRLSVYAFGHHRHYFDLDRNNSEYNAFAQGEWEYQAFPQAACGVNASYQFFDQFFDASISETELDSDRLKQQNIGVSPFASYVLLPRLTARVEGGYEIVRIDQSDDDYRQWQGLISLQGRCRSDLTLALTYGYELDDYDDREKRTSAGEVITGERVDIAGQDLGVHGSWYFDTARNWMMRWRLGRRLRSDDGGGYYDYEKWRGSIGLRGRMGRWSADARAGYSDTEYDERPSDIFDPYSALLNRRQREFGLRVERELGRRWTLFAEVAWEDHDGNDPLDVYDHMAGSVGLGYKPLAMKGR